MSETKPIYSVEIANPQQSATPHASMSAGDWSLLFSHLQANTHFDVPRIKAHIEQLERDAARYRTVKTLSREQLLLWRGAFGYSDDSIDDMK